jgi:hypothetical protein
MVPDLLALRLYLPLAAGQLLFQACGITALGGYLLLQLAVAGLGGCRRVVVCEVVQAAGSEERG